MEARKLHKTYTVDDYIQWEGDWELFDGVPVQWNPPHPEEMSGFRPGLQMSPSPIAPHQIVVSNIVRHIGNLLEAADACDCIVVSDLDWQISRSTVVRPDVSVLCPPTPMTYINKAPALIVEVLSPSTSERDLGEKRELYEQCGVSHYLIVDIECRAVDVLRLENGTFRPDSTDRLLHKGCGISLDLARFWQGLTNR